MIIPGGPELEHFSELVPSLTGCVKVASVQRLLRVIGYIFPCRKQKESIKTVEIELQRKY
jgi:hypothetical protein